MTDERLQIRSYRVVFDLERRIHRIDRYRIPLPYGLPLRSIAYALAGLLAVIALGRLPVLGALLALLPVPARLVLVPMAVSVALTRLRVDGRSAHAAGLAWMRWLAGPRRLVGFQRCPSPGRWVFADVLLATPEGSCARR